MIEVGHGRALTACGMLCYWVWNILVYSSSLYHQTSHRLSRSKPDPLSKRSNMPCTIANHTPNMLQRSKIRLSMYPPNVSSPGEPTHLASRFPACPLNQFPLSPGCSPISPSSLFFRVRLSTTHIPLVHWPEVSTRTSSPMFIFQRESEEVMQ